MFQGRSLWSPTRRLWAELLSWYQSKGAMPDYPPRWGFGAEVLRLAGLLGRRAGDVRNHGAHEFSCASAEGFGARAVVHNLDDAL